MTETLRSISVFVDEPDPGVFHWVLMQSIEDATTWLEHSASEESWPRWDEALAAGVAALRALADDPAIGPRASGEDEDADPVG